MRMTGYDEVTDKVFPYAQSDDEYPKVHDEDCLNLSIYAPADRRGKKLAVGLTKSAKEEFRLGLPIIFRVGKVAFLYISHGWLKGPSQFEKWSGHPSVRQHIRMVGLLCCRVLGYQKLPPSGVRRNHVSPSANLGLFQWCSGQGSPISHVA